MAALENLAEIPDVNIVGLRDPRTGNVEAVCVEYAKGPETLSERPRGLEHPPTTLPTCCPRYPPGSTVLECRLEGDQPVAHVVQVPLASSPVTQKMCLLLETRRSSSGPLSRVISRPVEKQVDLLETECQEQRVKRKTYFPMVYDLECRDRVDGSMAVASKTIEGEESRCSSLITTLETTKGGGCQDGPVSRVLYGPAPQEAAKLSCCAVDSQESPLTFIECTNTSRGPIARVTECSREDPGKDPSRRTRNCLEAFVGNDGTPMAAFRSNENTISSCRRDVLETRVDECGPRATMLTFPQECRGPAYCGYLESKSRDDGPTAKITQRFVENVIGDGVRKIRKPREPRTTFPSVNVVEPYEVDKTINEMVDRRNGLDPSIKDVRQKSLKKTPKKQLQICSPKCSESMQRESSTSKICTSIDSTLENQSRNDRPRVKVELEDCKEKTRRTKSEHVSIGRIDSEQLIRKYKEYIAPGQLHRYETCRSKRNGLQDECFLPVPRAVLELRKKEASRVDDNGSCDGSTRNGALEEKESDGNKEEKDGAYVDRKPTKPHVAGNGGFAPLISKGDEECAKELPRSICVQGF